MRATRPIRLVVLGVVVAALALACSRMSGKGKPDTDEVREKYGELSAKLDPDRLGASAKLMREFVASCGQFETGKKVQADLNAVPAKLADQFTNAKDQARGGNFAKAEAMLRDLADNFPDQEAGQRATNELEFEFPLFRARSLLASGDLDGGQAILRELRKGHLPDRKAELVEQMLDNVAVARTAEVRTIQARGLSMARTIQTRLAQGAAESGRFPATLSLDDLAKDEAGLFRALEYRSDGRTYRMTLVVNDAAQTKIAVTDSGPPRAEP